MFSNFLSRLRSLKHIFNKQEKRSTLTAPWHAKHTNGTLNETSSNSHINHEQFDSTIDQNDDLARPENLRVIRPSYYQYVEAHVGVSSRSNVSSTQAVLLSPQADLLSSQADLLSSQADLLSTHADLLSRQADILSTEVNLVSNQTDAITQVESCTRADIYTQESVSIQANVSTRAVASTQMDVSTQVDVSTPVDVSNHADVSTQVDVSTHADVSTQVDVSTHADVSTRAVASTQMDVSTQVDVSTPVDVSTHADVSTQVDDSTHADVSTQVDVSTQADVSIQETVPPQMEVVNQVDVSEQTAPAPQPDWQIILLRLASAFPQEDLRILRDVATHGNMLNVRVEMVRERQWFAQETNGNIARQLVKTEPTRLRISRNRNLSIDEHAGGMREQEIETEVVLKMFLNGVTYATDHFITVCLSVVVRNDEHTIDVRQNVLEEHEWLIASVCLKQPISDDNPYRRDFRMKFCSQLERGEKGLIRFIEKTRFEEFIAENGSVDVQLSLRIGSFE